MNQFSIKDIENLTGIRAHTLRIWEQRYDIFRAKRKESRHRVYDNDDLKVLLRIAYLNHHGYKISRIASMNPEEINDAVRKTAQIQGGYEIFVHQLIEAAVDFDRERFDKILNALILRNGIESAIFNVCYPYLQRIGLLWMTGNVIPAQEHFSSHIIRKKIVCAIDGLEPPKSTAPRILLFSPAGEYHELPLLVADYLLRKAGCQTVYLGENTSSRVLENYLMQNKVDFVFGYISNCPLDCNTEEYFSVFRKYFPGQKILIAGALVTVVPDLPFIVQPLYKPHELPEYIRDAWQKKNTNS